MTHRDKLTAMYRHIAILGVSKGTAAPPIFRLLWRLGIEVPPPLFISFIPAALGMGVFFGFFWGLVMWAILWSRQGMSFGLMASPSLVAGVLFGLSMAAYYRYLARKYELPSWADYTGAPQRA